MTGYGYDPHPAVTAAREAAERVRDLNHATLSSNLEGERVDVVTIYDTLAALTIALDRLPQALAQLDARLTRLIEDGKVKVVDGEHRGDPVALAVTVSIYLDEARAHAGWVATELNAAFQALTWAAPTDPGGDPDDATRGEDHAGDEDDEAHDGGGQGRPGRAGW